MDNLDFSDEDFFRHLPKGDHERPLHLLRLSSKCDSDTDSYTSVPDTQGRRFIKRKVLRKHKGEPHVCDESFYIEDSDSASCLEEGLSKLHLSTSTQPDFDTENSTSPSDSPANERLSLSAFESYIRDMIDTQSDGDHRPKSKSFIRPVISQHTIKKTDPVAKYFQYKHHWDRLKLPGERDRRALRCEIKVRKHHVCDSCSLRMFTFCKLLWFNRRL
ncbi:putative hydrolethalus syndrome protein 1 -like isoform 4 [Scophthalmus maximus]|uniref:Putative hydrolethalus syndrome protein 1-like isoform 4 n=1 Tax=Scophthalmus maximus TaxID=52904 RepID=A0A2U9BNB1_SCOMX|nr:putative hydrolethalus syndrome protein 1 -like isoform 4 [Scophthalmus maximus]